MKNVLVTLICGALLLISTSSLNAQVKFGISAGLTNITGPTGYTNKITDNGWGFGAALNAGAQLRINIPLVPLTPVIFADYHMLKGSEGTYLGDVKTSQNILSIGANLQYNILPLPLIKPYISVGAALNSFGELKIEYPNGSSISGKSASRTGGLIGVGTLITALPAVDIDISLKYQFLNMLGKDDGEESINAVTLNAAILF